MRDLKQRQEYFVLSSAALTLNRGQRVTWAVAILLSFSIAAFVVFGVARSTAQLGENSPFAQKYTDVANTSAMVPEHATVNSAWGNDGGTETMVLYDTAGAGSGVADAETHNIVSVNMATHFGKVQAPPMVDHVAGDVSNFNDSDDTHDGNVIVGDMAAVQVSSTFADGPSGNLPGDGGKPGKPGGQWPNPCGPSLSLLVMGVLAATGATGLLIHKRRRF